MPWHGRIFGVEIMGSLVQAAQDAQGQQGEGQLPVDGVAEVDADEADVVLDGE